ncbi:SDR family oxidoreductase [Sphingomonas bacterium]|uniref:SDR family oxidoreductase n=1 Tax=Sphingomonas bacterium TaxID=1895847 RepID=UPI001575BF24|nr:SDR family oxidoreductase [Sphingomonas bacterium]
MILVTGATGTNGREILKALAAKQVPARAMVRAADEAGDLPPGITRVEGDFDDEASLARALTGVERAFLLTPSTEHAEAQQKRFVAAAVDAGVRHIVKLSQFAASPDSPVRFLRYHAAVEATIRASGLDWTFLRPNLFMQGLLQFAGMIRDQGMFAAPIGDARVSVVDVRDNAAVAAAALTGAGHAGRTYTLTGPEALSHAEMAARLSAATGRTIRFVDASDDDLRHAMAGVGMPEWQVEGLVEDYAHYARGEASVVEHGVQEATSTAARDFDGFARDHAGAFGGVEVRP